MRFNWISRVGTVGFFLLGSLLGAQVTYEDGDGRLPDSGGNESDPIQSPAKPETENGLANPAPPEVDSEKHFSEPVTDDEQLYERVVIERPSDGTVRRTYDYVPIRREDAVEGGTYYVKRYRELGSTGRRVTTFRPYFIRPGEKKPEKDPNADLDVGEYKTNLDAIVVITGDKSKGTGFIAEMRGQHFVVTNLHVLAGNKSISLRTANGMEMQPQAMFAAHRQDIALLKIDPAPDALTIQENLTDEISVGMTVVCPGNSGGGEVVTDTKGKVRGIGPDLVEVDARFVRGNSGGPIIAVDTGNVIGVCTYVVTLDLDELSERAGKADTRWFGYRIDSITDWEQVNWMEFYRQSEKIQAVTSRTESFITLFTDEGRIYDEQVMRNYDQLRRDMINFEGSHDYAHRKFRKFVSSLRVLAESDIDELRYQRFYGYFQKQLEDHRGYREEIKEALERADRDLILGRR